MHDNPRATTFIGGRTGSMSVTSQETLSGEPVARVEAVEMVSGIAVEMPADAKWSFHGVTSNDRYTTRAEKTELVGKQVPVGRPEASRAALILLRKRAEWWALAQDERRAVLEEDSHHIAIGMRYLPAVSRHLLHCRDLGGAAAFDFIGFLDFAPESETAFDAMLVQLRATREWSYMEREIEIRLNKGASPREPRQGVHR
jgi:hypothetical protein